MKIAAVGETTYDHYVNQNRSFVGGIALNFAVQASRCGAEAALVSRVGTDREGELVLAKLRAEGVDTSHVLVCPGRTATIKILVDELGEQSYPADGYAANVLADFRLQEDELDFLHQQDVVAVHFEGFRQETPLFALFMDPDRPLPGKRVADLGGWLRRADTPEKFLPVLNHLELAFANCGLADVPRLQTLTAQHSCLLILTHGRDGSTALTSHGLVYQPALPVAAVVDATGCGDAFQAAFTVTYFRTGDVSAALAAGAAQATQVIGHYGAL